MTNKLVLICIIVVLAGAIALVVYLRWFSKGVENIKGHTTMPETTPMPTKQ